MDKKKLILLRHIYTGVMDCYAHALHLHYLYWKAGDEDSALYFKKCCVQTSHTLPFVVDCGLIFLKLGMGLKYDAKTSGLRSKNLALLKNRYDRVKQQSIHYHLGQCGVACVNFLTYYVKYREAGFCVTDDLASDDAYFRARSSTFKNILKFVEKRMEDYSTPAE